MKVLKAEEKHAWKPEWQALLKRFKGLVPKAWIEQGFKHSKRSGWQWQHTRMDDPARAERLWMAITIATWWLLSVGGEAEADEPLDIKLAI